MTKALFLFLILFSFSTYASEDEDWGEEEEDDSSGFEEIESQKEDLETDKANNFNFYGNYRSSKALWSERLNTEASAKLRQNLDLYFNLKGKRHKLFLSLHSEYDFIYLINESQYDQPTKDLYQWQLFSKESYYSYSNGSFDFYLGMLFSNWGESDSRTLLDPAGAMDLREPGAADMVDLKLSSPTAKFGYYFSNHGLELSIILMPRFGLKSPPFGPFSPFKKIILMQPSGKVIFDILKNKNIRYSDDVSGDPLQNQQYLFRWMYRGEGMDLGFYAARYLDQQGILSLPKNTNFFNQKNIDFVLLHTYQNLFGGSGAHPINNFIIKWETAFIKDKTFNISKSDGGLESISSSKTDIFSALLGLTYSGLSNTTIGFEVSKSWLKEKMQMLLDPEKPSFSLRFLRKLDKERAEILLVASMLGTKAEQGWFSRAQANYKISDPIKLSLGYIVYHSGTEMGPFAGFDHHDRLFIDFRLDF